MEKVTIFPSHIPKKYRKDTEPLLTIYQGVHITYFRSTLSLPNAYYSLVHFQTAYKMTTQTSVLAEQ